jgi:hypothetical protein
MRNSFLLRSATGTHKRCDEWFNWALHCESERTGRLAARHDILDVSTLSPLQLTGAALPLMQAFMERTKHYPETVARITSCGNSWAGLAIWAVVKNAVDPATRAKLAVLGTPFRHTLRERNSAAVLPPSFGGIYAPFVRDEDGVLSVAARSRYDLRVCLRAGERLNARWCILARDIEGSAATAAAGSVGPGDAEGSVVVAEPKRVARTDGVQHIVIAAPAEEGCVATLSWDNRYSWLRAKQLWLRAVVEGAAATVAADPSAAADAATGTAT